MFPNLILTDSSLSPVPTLYLLFLPYIKIMISIAGDHNLRKLSLTIAGGRGDDKKDAHSKSSSMSKKSAPLTLVIAGGYGKGSTRTAKLMIASRGKQGIRRLSLAGRQTANVTTTTSPQKNSFFVVDTFGQAASFSGTSVATVFLSNPADEAWMQLTASQLNLKQLSFVAPLGSNADAFSIRAFSPTIEIDLPGLSAVAAAKALLSRNSALSSVQLHSKVGVITGRLTKHGRLSVTYLRHEAVIVASKSVGTGIKEYVCRALGVCPSHCTKVLQTKYDTVIVLDDATLVKNLRPDFLKLVGFPTRAITVTARTDGNKDDVIARTFSPCLGVNSSVIDPSAISYLVPFWAPLLNSRTVRFANGDYTLDAVLEGDNHSTQTVTVTGNADILIATELKTNNFLRARM